MNRLDFTARIRRKLVEAHNYLNLADGCSRIEEDGTIKLFIFMPACRFRSSFSGFAADWNHYWEKKIKRSNWNLRIKTWPVKKEVVFIIYGQDAGRFAKFAMMRKYKNNLLVIKTHNGEKSSVYGNISNPLFKEEMASVMPEVYREINSSKSFALDKAPVFNHHSLPIATGVIILLNLILTLYVDKTSLAANYGLDPSLIKSEGFRLLTYMFCHASIFHFFANMFALGSIGTYVERKLGSVMYTLIYLFAGVVGGYGSVHEKLLNGVFVPTVGASGAVWGIVGAALVVGFFDVFTNKEALAIQFFVQLVIIITSFKFANIDNICHIYGYIGGVIGTLLLGFVLTMLTSVDKAKADRIANAPIDGYIQSTAEKKHGLKVDETSHLRRGYTRWRG